MKVRSVRVRQRGTATGRRGTRNRSSNYKLHRGRRSRPRLVNQRRGLKSKQVQLDLRPFQEAGQLAGRQVTGDHAVLEKHMFSTWNAHAANIAELDSTEVALRAGRAFMQGYTEATGHSLQLVPLPLRKSAAAVVCACNEEQTIGKVLVQLKRLPLQDIVVILNGTTDSSLKQVLQQTGITLVYEPDRAGHDIGRALGAKMTNAEIVLFVDGDMVVPAEQLAPFLFAIDRGQDVALNDLTSLIPPFAKQDEVSRIKAYLNRTLGRPDLGCNSMTAVPHAVSRHMIQTVQPSALAVPPKAQLLAMQQGLQVSAPCQVDVIRSNRLRAGNTGSGNDVARLIIGDHLEALAAWLNLGGNAEQARVFSRTEVAYRRNAR